MKLDKLKQTLKAKGYSLTTARQLVFELLDNQEPQTMQVLISRARRQIDRATLYRTIDLYEQLGIVNRINIGWKYKIELSDGYSHHHHHLHCLNCSTIISVPEDPILERRIKLLSTSARFIETAHQLEIQGYCEACAHHANALQ